MTELEVDQSNLPKVQEVCQCFAVLEDGALAHNLQEQEIEQYYSSNVQRSQLVQNDIRIARRLQDEEEQIATVLQRQASSRLEQQDSEYARLIQEEIERCAEEARRSEQEDEEIAKRIQEEEELLVRQRCRSRTTDNGENYSAPAPPYPSYSAPVLLSGEEGEEEQYLFPPARRWQHSSSPSNSDFEEDLREHCRPVHRVTRDQVYRNYRTAEDQRGPLTRVRTSSASDNRSCTSQSSRVPQLSGGWADALQLIKNDLSKQGYLSGSSEDEMLFEPVCRLEEILNQYRNSSTETSHRGKGTRHSSIRESVGRTWQGDRASRTDSYRSSDYKDNSSVKYEPRRVRRYNSSCSDYRPSRVGSWSFRDSREKRVHFQDERSRFSGYNGDSQRALEGRPNGFREQREAEDFHNSIESQSLGRQDSRRITQLSRDSPLRRSYHGDVRVVRRTSQCANSRDFSHGDRRHGNGRRAYESQSIQESSVAEFTEENSSGGLRERGRGEGGNHRFSRNHRQRVQSLGEYCREEEEGDSRRYHGGRRTRPSLSERREEYEEERTSTDEEEEEERERRRRREERRPRRLQRSRSLSCRGRSSRAGALLSREDASLHLRELQQVLQDEELARTLQEEENKLLRGNPQSSRLLRRQYPEGDFRAAQVAQDEEIARFIQKQEIRTQRRSREFDGVGPGQNRDMPDVNDRRVTHERQVQRERLDSEGLPSPTEDCSPDHQPPSPISMAAQPVRNIAEELDPTFQRKESTRAEHTISETCQPQAAPQVGLYDQTEEPAFVPPTKRQSEKGGRGKSKEKKESVRQRENCKQQ